MWFHYWRADSLFFHGLFHRGKKILLLGIVTGLSVLLTGCGGTDFQLPSRDLSTPDIHPLSRGQVRDGGIFLQALRNWPSNFNHLSLDGSLADLYTIYQAVTFDAFKEHYDGTLYYDPAYFTDIHQYFMQGKQKIIYTLNPQAHWSTGKPITWRDFAMLAHVLSGKDPRYIISSSNGYNDIESVEQGANDRQFIVTMKVPYGEWQGLFMYMLPAEAIDTPEKFNQEWITRFPPTAGPFKIHSINPVTQSVTVVKDPTWWGQPPKLDTIVFKVIPTSSGVSSYLTGEMSTADIESDVSALQQALTHPHTDIRRAYSNQYMHLDFNCASDRITHDKQVRHAIAHAIDRQFLEVAYAGPVVGKNPPVLNNHFVLRGLPGYRDNNQGFEFNPDQARKELETTGWHLGAQGVRYKNGVPLLLHYLTRSGASVQARSVDQIIQQQLAAVGIRMIIDTVPNTDFFPRYVQRGNYDLTNFKWEQDITPISSGRSIFELDPRCIKNTPDYNPSTCAIEQNYGLMGSREINRLYDQLLGTTDVTLRLERMNALDKLLWDDMGQLPIFQIPAIFVVSSQIANWGVSISPTIVWTDVGYAR